MQRDYLKKIFKHLCGIFYSGTVVIKDKSTQAIYVFPEGSDIPQAAQEETYFSIHRQQAVLQIPIASNWMAYIWASCSSEEEAKRMRSIARGIVELVQQQEELLGKVSLSQDNMAFLANRLFNSTSPESIAYVALWGIDLGFDLTLPRAICVFQIKTSEASAALKDSTCRSVLHTIKTFPGYSSQDIAAQLNNNQIVLCKQVQSREEPLRDQVYTYISELCSFLMNRYHISVNVGISGPPVGIADYSVGLQEAQTALKYTRIFSANQSIAFFSDYALETEIARIPPEILHHFLGDKLQRLRASSQMLETVEALIQNNMDVSAAAEQLFIHRNTAVFRVNQIKKILGLNPLHNDSDRFALMALYIYHKITA